MRKDLGLCKDASQAAPASALWGDNQTRVLCTVTSHGKEGHGGEPTGAGRTWVVCLGTTAATELSRVASALGDAGMDYGGVGKRHQPGRHIETTGKRSASAVFRWACSICCYRGCRKVWWDLPQMGFRVSPFSPPWGTERTGCPVTASSPAQ